MRGGREEEFRSLLQQNRKILFKICNAYCSAAQDREDLAQDIIIQLWRSFPTFDASARFSTWMYRVALNVAISARRADQSRTRRISLGDEQLLTIADDAEGPSDELQTLHRMIANLDDISRSLLLLYLDGYSLAETAQILGLSETNVSTRINRIKQKMRAQALQTTPA